MQALNPMAPFDQDRKYALADLAMALNHDIRVRLMQLHMEDSGRSLTAAALQADLARDERFRDVTISQVQYHLARLQDVELLPTE